MVSKGQKLLINCIDKLLKKYKVVFVANIKDNENIPSEIRVELLSGNICSKINNYYAYNKGIVAITETLGTVNGKNTFCFHIKNKKFIESILKKNKELVEEYRKQEEILRNIKMKIAKLRGF